MNADLILNPLALLAVAAHVIVAVFGTLAGRYSRWTPDRQGPGL